ncbi:uncharacterized protein Jupiter isoform X2 [Prorops nasuta]|uniref:uncharacterized protein Jupiter isoform X2 n=1 Tax=Prorops nasuta TaxID=863751 RepID=UPI0034CE563A
MTSTGTFQGLVDQSRNSSKVLKPPGGGSSDIFGTGPEETSARRVKQHNQSQLSSTLFGSDATNQNNAGSNGPEKVAARTKPGNDSYKRLFGPPDAPAVSPNSKNHMRSNISLSGGGDLSSPEKSTRRSSSSTIISSSSNGCLNGHASSNACYNDITAFRRIKRFHMCGWLGCWVCLRFFRDGIDAWPYWVRGVSFLPFLFVCLCWCAYYATLRFVSSPPPGPGPGWLCLASVGGSSSNPLQEEIPASLGTRSPDSESRSPRQDAPREGAEMSIP